MNKEIESLNFDFSIVIPIFNGAETIERTVQSLSTIEYSKEKFEVILVNDGSTDETLYKLSQINSIFDNLQLKIIDKENGGVASARNHGIKNSAGKYILFLDADDTLSPNTLSGIYPFFEEYYEDIDILTYDLVYLGSKKKHFRSRLVDKSQVFDANNTIGITLSTINICVKNKFSSNFFFDENLFMHEDEEYSCRVVMDKGKFGYVKGISYIYDNKVQDSATATRLHPYYSFDSSMSMYEKLLRHYIDSGKEVPLYIQNLIVNDFSWKLRSNVLLSEGAKNFVEHKKRVIDVINCISCSAIINHPNVDKYHKHYFLSLKAESPQIMMEGEKILMDIDGQTVHLKENNVYVHRVKIDNNKIIVSCVFKNPVFNYLEEDCFGVFSIQSGKLKNINLEASHFSYHRCKTKTNKFFSFDLNFDLKKDVGKELKVGVIFNKHAYLLSDIVFAKDSFFSPLIKGKRYTFISKNCLVFDNNKKSFLLQNRREYYKNYLKNFSWSLGRSYKKSMLVALCSLPRKEKIWIYNDKNDLLDNAYLQFKNDLKKNDGIKRYYVYYHQNDYVKIIKDGIPKHLLVKSKSFHHKYIYFRCDIVFTSFADESFYLPASPSNYHQNYSNKFAPKIVYLQHGVLHAITNNYASEFKHLDYVVVSTIQEKNLYLNLGYKEEQLLSLGMPRYSGMKKSSFNKLEIKKILYLPSWRSFLAHRDQSNNWKINQSKFLKSSFFKGLNDLFTDKDFHAVLKNHKISLDVSPHPLFQSMDVIFPNSDGVSLISEYKINDYDLIITDYSSVVYDAVFFGKIIFYYCPDIEEIEHGLNLYVETGTPMKNGFGPFCESIKDLSHNIESYLNDSDKFFEKYSLKYEGCFLDFSDSCEAIYNKFKDFN